MAVKFLLTEGIGLSPGSPTYIVLDGLNANPTAGTTIEQKKTTSALGTKLGVRQLQGQNNG
jgi:hypothetical protein